MKSIFCRVADGQIDPERCYPEDKKCLSCPQRKVQRKRSKTISKKILKIDGPAISEVEIIFQERVFPELKKLKLFGSRPYQGKVAGCTYSGTIRDQYRLPSPPGVFNPIGQKPGVDFDLIFMPGKEGVIFFSKELLRNWEVFEKAPRPFRKAEEFCDFLAITDQRIDEYYPILSPWLNEESSEELVRQIKERMEKLSSNIKTAIGPEIGGRTKHKNWPLFRYISQLAQLYEIDTRRQASARAGLFLKFATICLKNLGFDLTEDQIDHLVRQYRAIRYCHSFLR